jgi:hypothetical protein
MLSGVVLKTLNVKKYIIPLLLMILVYSSCQKEDAAAQIPEDKGCIEWKKVSITDHSGYTINNSNIPIITGLFSGNNIDYSKYRYYYYSDDSLQTYFPPYAKIDQKIIRVKEFTNGLEIFTGGIVFLFHNNILYNRHGDTTSGTTLNTSPNLTVGQIRSLFLGHIEQFDKNGNQYKDSCFSAEFGYYNTNSGTGNPTENLIKSWKVTLKNRIYPLEVPIAYYQDNDGKLIYYDNGIRTFR